MPPLVNWDSASELPAQGRYLMEIKDCMLGISKAGDEYMRLSLEIVDDGVKVTDILSWSPRAGGILRRKLRALGMEGKENISENDLIGLRVLGYVKHEEGMDGEIQLAIDISAKGSQAGYEPCHQGEAEASRNPSNKQNAVVSFEDDFDDDIPI